MYRLEGGFSQLLKLVIDIAVTVRVVGLVDT